MVRSISSLFPSLLASPIGTIGLPRLGEILIECTALLILLFAVAAVLRRTSAGTRHVVWSAGLGAVLALPVLAAVVPFRLEVLPRLPVLLRSDLALPAGMGTGSAEAPMSPTLAAEPVAVELATSQASAAVADDLSDGAREAPTARAAREETPSATEGTEGSEGAGPTAAGAGGEREVAAEDLAGDRPRPKAETVLWWLLAAWVIGALVLLARVGGGALAVWRITRRGRALESTDWTTPLWEAADRLELRRVPRLLMSERVRLPFTCGLLRPAIVLPASAVDWTDERRRAVLFHELGHVRRFDLPSHLVGRLACALYWFHPLVWLAARRARAASERACDDLVLSTGTRASTYAEHLLQVVSGAARSTAPTVAIPMAQRNEFEGRMLAILEPGARRRGPGRGQSAVLAASVAMLALSVVALAPAREPTSMEARQAPEPLEHAGGDAEDPLVLEGASDREATTSPSARDAGAARFAPGAAAGLSVSGTGIRIPGRSTAPTPRVAAADTDRAGRRSHRGHDLHLHSELGVALAERISSQVRATFNPLEFSERLELYESLELSERIASDVDAVVGPIIGDVVGSVVDPTVSAALDVASAASATASAAARASTASALRGWRSTPIPTPTPAPAPAPFAGGGRPYQEGPPSSRSGAVQTRAVSALVSALGDPIAEVRSAAAHTLAEVGDSAAVAALSDAVRTDPDAEVRRAAAWALGEIGDRMAVPALSAAVRSDDNAEVRRMAAWALGELEDERAIEALGAATTDTDPSVAAMALWALGEIDSPNAAPYLAPALASSSVEVRRRAVWALAETEAAAAVEPLIAALQDEDAEVRDMAAWGLGELEDPRAAAGLAAALADRAPEVRRKAAWALGELDLSRAPEPLNVALNDSDEDVRRMAAWALGEIADPASVQALTAALDDASAEVRRASFRALGEIAGPAAQEALIEAIRSEDPEIRKMAARALARTY